MARCPACLRRLPASGACPRDGARAPAEPPVPEQPAPALGDPRVAIGERVGVGGFATTWAARFGGAAAILKLAHRSGPVPAARFAHEYDVLRHLGGAGAPAPLALGQLADGRPYILMSRTMGTPLSVVLADAERAWSVAEAAELIAALCRRLAEVHARGVVHGDLKPENVLVGTAEDRDGGSLELGIVDFGVASGAALASAPPAGVGTIEYMAPEQLRGQASGAPTDVYAVAAILFELLVGHPPFAGDRSTIAFQLRNMRPPRLRYFAAVPQAIDELVARCLEKRPEDRPADARALLDELRAAAADQVEAVSTQTADRARPAAAPARASCALVAVAVGASIAPLSDAMQRRGGVLAKHRGNHLVFAFEAGRHLLPPRAAAEAAAAVATPEQGATVHVATLTVRRRADGTPAFFGHELEHVEDWARAAPGVSFTDAAAAALAPFALDAPRPMIGRADVLADLLGLAERALAGEGPGLALVTAAPGLGKTMLLEAIAGAVRCPTVVSISVARPFIGGPPNAARELLERLPPGGELDDLARAAAAWILDPRLDRAIAPLRAAPGALRAATTRALASGIARAARRPLAIVVDDAQLADDAVLDALAAAVRTLAGAPLFVIAAARPGLERPDLLERAPLARAIELAPLSAEASAALARMLLAPVEVIPEAVLERLRARTQGHPLELIELTAALRRAGAIGQSERGRWELDPAVLDRVLEGTSGSHLSRWLAEEAFADLPASLLAHAELVALLGGDASARDLREVIAELDRAGGGGRFPLDAERGLELLREAGVLVRTGETYRFRRAVLADVREAVGLELARAVHGAAYAAYARRDDLAPDVRLARQALHAHSAGRHDLAAPLYLELGRLALARHRYADAELALGRALAAPEALPASSDRGLAHWQRGIARYRMGRHDAAAADFELARADARARGDRAREAEVLLDLAMSLDWALEFRAADRRVDEAAALIGDTAAPRLRAYLAVSAARSHLRAGREVEAIAPLERAIELAAPLGDEAYEILVVALLQSAPILATWGRPEEARRQFERVLALTEAAGDRLHHCAGLANRMCRPFATPDVESLRADHARVLAIAGELGHFLLEFTGEVNLAGGLHHLGHRELALEHARRAVELERTRLGDAARPEAAALLARILAARGDHAEAAAVVAAIDAHQAAARAAPPGRGPRAEALLLPAEQVLLDGVRLAAGLPCGAAPDALRARGAGLLPRHELAELEALLAAAPRRAT